MKRHRMAVTLEGSPREGPPDRGVRARAAAEEADQPTAQPGPAGWVQEAVQHHTHHGKFNHGGGHFRIRHVHDLDTVVSGVVIRDGVGGPQLG